MSAMTVHHTHEPCAECSAKIDEVARLQRDLDAAKAALKAAQQDGLMILSVIAEMPRAQADRSIVDWAHRLGAVAKEYVRRALG